MTLVIAFVNIVIGVVCVCVAVDVAIRARTVYSLLVRFVF